jgi:ribonuclease HI
MQSSIFSFFTPVSKSNDVGLHVNRQADLHVQSNKTTGVSKTAVAKTVVSRSKPARVTNMDSFIGATANVSSSTGASAGAGAIKKTHHDEYVLFFDGCSKNNPGPSGAGAVLYHNGVEIWSTAVFVGHKETNNVAEYTGMIVGIKRAAEMGIRRLVVKGDSNLVVQQMNGKFRVNADHIKPLYATAKNIIRNFDSIQFVHVYRHLNQRADELSNMGLESKIVGLG